MDSGDTVMRGAVVLDNDPTAERRTRSSIIRTMGLVAGVSVRLRFCLARHGLGGPVFGVKRFLGGNLVEESELSGRFSVSEDTLGGVTGRVGETGGEDLGAAVRGGREAPAVWFGGPEDSDRPMSFRV